MEKDTVHVEDSTGPAAPSTEAAAHEVPLGSPSPSMMDSIDLPVPPGYFHSLHFLGTMAAVGLALLGSIGGFALAAPILGAINDDIGPNRNIAWVPLVFPVGVAVGQPLMGRLSDIFGRRWFLAGTQALGVLGAIISSTAKNVATLIGGSSLIGLAASGALSYPFILGEILPMKWRFMGNGYVNLWSIPFSGLSPVVANSFVKWATWRWCYYVMIIANSLSMLCYILFYHPPTFEMKHSRSERLRLVRQLDWSGLGLFISGVVLFLLGISWGGNVYSWQSPAVISTIVIGGLLMVAFFLWEIYHPSNEPFVLMYLFKNRGWLLSSILVSVPASVYYGVGVIWPQMVNVIYSNGDVIYAGWLQCSLLGPYTLGLIMGNVVYKYTGHIRAHLVISTAIGGAFLGAAAASTPASKAVPIGLLCPGAFFLGCVEAQTFTLPGMYIDNQEDIGAAVGVAGSFRSVFSTTASTIFVAVLNNRLAKTVPAAVIPAAVQAGLPRSSVSELLSALQAGTNTAIQGVRGLTPHIQEVAIAAYKEGSMSAYRTVFFATLAFTGFGVVCAAFMPSIDHKMTDHVAVRLHKVKDQKDLESKAQVMFEHDQK